MTTIAIKTYAAKSKAIRALRDTFNLNDAQIEKLLVQDGNAKWGFDRDLAQAMKDGTTFVPAEVITKVEGLKDLEPGTYTVGGEAAAHIINQTFPLIAPAIVPTSPVVAGAKKPSAKNHLRALMGTGNSYTMTELLYGDHYTVANIKTALSDLKNAYYADGPVLLIKRTRIEGVDYYSL